MNDIAYGFLKNFSTGRSLSTHDLSVLLNVDSELLIPPVKSLIKCGYIQSVHSGDICTLENFSLDTKFKITFDGSTALILHEQEKRRFCFSELRAWCTLAIAIAAFIKSFFF